MRTFITWTPLLHWPGIDCGLSVLLLFYFVLFKNCTSWHAVSSHQKSLGGSRGNITAETECVTWVLEMLDGLQWLSYELRNQKQQKHVCRLTIYMLTLRSKLDICPKRFVNILKCVTLHMCSQIQIIAMSKFYGFNQGITILDNIFVYNMKLHHYYLES